MQEPKPKIVTKGLFNSTEELIDNVFRMTERDSPVEAIKRMCGVSEVTIKKILDHFEPSLDTKIEILDSKIYKGQRNGHNVDYLMEEKEGLLKVKKPVSKKNANNEHQKHLKHSHRI